jgi:hypothetical protein
MHFYDVKWWKIDENDEKVMKKTIKKWWKNDEKSTLCKNVKNSEIDQNVEKGSKKGQNHVFKTLKDFAFQRKIMHDLNCLESISIVNIDKSSVI